MPEPTYISKDIAITTDVYGKTMPDRKGLRPTSSVNPAVVSIHGSAVAQPIKILRVILTSMCRPRLKKGSKSK